MASSLSPLPFKSKKPLLSSTPIKPPPQPSIADVTTPDRVNPPPRLRNQNFALSLSDVRRSALQMRSRSLDGSDPPGKVSGVGTDVVKSKRSEKSVTLLPEKYEMLCDFFDAMVSSTRLLRLKKLASTFTRLSRNIESLTDRRFKLQHLAQLKHVVPEVITLKKIRVQDEETSCMKEELLVSLDADGVEIGKNTKVPSGLSQLKGIFRSRVIEYAREHPEGDDIPEGELPQLFYVKKDSEPNTNGASSMSVAVSHIAPSFKRKFSARLLNASLPESSPAKPSTCMLETPIKETISTEVESPTSSSIQGTPVELVSTPSKFMTTTPAIRPLKHSFMSPDHDANNLSTKSAKRRSLKFDENCGDVEDKPSNVDDYENKIEVSSASKDVLNVLPDDLLHSLLEKERKALIEQDPIVSQARKRQKLMDGVPKLFDMIRLIFQSMRRSVITKEELIHKIVAGHLDIVDKNEIEGQLKLLQEVAPEFINEKSCLSGDILLRLNKSLSPELIRAKLVDAE